MQSRWILLLSASVCLLASLLCGQTTTANLYGIIRDSSGAVVPGAQVTITNEGTSQSFSTVADAAGEFAFSFLRPATYGLVIEAPGFKRFVSGGLDLGAGQQSRQQFTLELGSISESVTVSADASMVSTVSAEQQQSIDTTRVSELPLARRNFTSLLSIGTGVIMSGTDHGTVRMNGMGQSGTNISLDGTYASSNPEGRSTGAFQNFNQIDVVSIEAIQEVQTVKGVAPAEYGNALGGQVNVITRSGTNQWHGSLFHNFQSEELNARPQTLATKAPAVFNQFGGSSGGPIRKNQIFIFGAFEGYRDRTAQVVQGNVPTASIREELLRAVPSYSLALDILPLPNQPHNPAATSGLFIGPGSLAANDNHAVVKGDIKLSSLSNLALTYTRMRPDSLQPRFALNGANDRTYVGSIDRGTASYILSRAVWTSETRLRI
jgi:Carboxypeptidase regulatory-like domain/TonB-dependent Receptor Plug Domain